MARRQADRAEARSAPGALLGQVGAQELVRLARERWPPPQASRHAEPRAAAGPSGSLPRLAVKTVSAGILASGVLFTALAIAGAADAAGDGRITSGEALRLAVLAFATLALGGQLLRFGSRLWQHSAAEPAGARAPLLGLVSAEALAALVPVGFGTPSALRRARIGFARAADTGGWVLLGALILGLAGFFVLGVVSATWSFLDRGPGAIPLAVSLVILALSVGGFVLLALTTILGLRDRRRRRRRALFQRATRYGLRAWDRATSSAVTVLRTATGGGSDTARAGVGVAAALAILIVSVGPLFGESDAGEASAAPDARTQPSPASAPSTATAGAGFGALAATATSEAGADTGLDNSGGDDGQPPGEDGPSQPPSAAEDFKVPGGGGEAPVAGDDQLTNPDDDPGGGPVGGSGSLAPRPDPQGAPPAPAPPPPAPAQASSTPTPTPQPPTRTPTRTRTATRTPTQSSGVPLPTRTPTPLSFKF